jgi:hypothetical protein
MQRFGMFPAAPLSTWDSKTVRAVARERPAWFWRGVGEPRR